MMSHNYPEGTVLFGIFLFFLIEKKKETSITHVPMGESQYYLVSFCDQKGKVRLLSRRRSMFADSEKVQLCFQIAFLIKLN